MPHDFTFKSFHIPSHPSDVDPWNVQQLYSKVSIVYCDTSTVTDHFSSSPVSPAYHSRTFQGVQGQFCSSRLAHFSHIAILSDRLVFFFSTTNTPQSSLLGGERSVLFSAACALPPHRLTDYLHSGIVPKIVYFALGCTPVLRLFTFSMIARVLSAAVGIARYRRLVGSTT